VVYRLKFLLFTLSGLKVKEGGLRINLLKFMSDFLDVMYKNYI